MNNDISLQTHLRQIFQEAVESHWDTIAPYFQDLAFNYLKERSWQIQDALSLASEAGLKAALAKHTATTYAPVFEQLAQAELRKKLAQRLKARGLSTSLLDSIPEV